MSTDRNHPNPEALYPVMKRHEVLLLAACEKGWVNVRLLGTLAIDTDEREPLLVRWTGNGLLEERTVRDEAQKNFISYVAEYRATRAGKFVIKGWREAGWIE